MLLHPFSDMFPCSGEQWNATVCDLQRPPRMTTELHWLACYVMLSRATDLEGLLIARLCTRDELARGPPQFLLDEIKRLQSIEDKSLKTLEAYIRRVWPDAPEDLLALLSTLSDEYTFQDTSSVHIPEPKSTKPSTTISPIAAECGRGRPTTLAAALKEQSGCIPESLWDQHELTFSSIGAGFGLNGNSLWDQSDIALGSPGWMLSFFVPGENGG